MEAERKEIKQHKPLPVPNSDFYELVETLPAEELAIVKQVRVFMETKVAPIITKYWVDDAFPFELLPSLKELNIGGVGMQGYGCRGGSGLLFGLIAMEMARFDSSIATFFGVHNGLAMGSIYLGGSEEQKQKWLPPLARWEKNRLLRPDGTASWVWNLRRDVDDCEAGWRHLDHQRSEKVDWQLSVVRHIHHLGSRPGGQPSQGVHRGEQDHAWLQGGKDSEQDRTQGGAERPHHDGGLPNT